MALSNHSMFALFDTWLRLTCIFASIVGSHFRPPLSLYSSKGSKNRMIMNKVKVTKGFKPTLFECRCSFRVKFCPYGGIVCSKHVTIEIIWTPEKY